MRLRTWTGGGSVRYGSAPGGILEPLPSPNRRRFEPLRKPLVVLNGEERAQLVERRRRSLQGSTHRVGVRLQHVQDHRHIARGKSAGVAEAGGGESRSRLVIASQRGVDQGDAEQVG